MMSGVSPETCWAIKKHWNNKFYYTVACCWFFLWDLYYDAARIHEHEDYSLLCLIAVFHISMPHSCIQPKAVSVSKLHSITKHLLLGPQLSSPENLKLKLKPCFMPPRFPSPRPMPPRPPTPLFLRHHVVPPFGYSKPDPQIKSTK
jgi:hypothetical protein